MFLQCKNYTENNSAAGKKANQYDRSRSSVQMTISNAIERLVYLAGVLVLASPAFAQITLPEVQRRYANSTVFIAVKYETVDGKTPTSGCKKGSGFLISESGYVTTSYHLFTDDKNRPFDKINAVLGKVGESFDCDQPLGDVVQLDRIVSLAEIDAALLKFISPKAYVPIPACLGPVVPNGNSLYVLGFPLGLPLASQTVIKSNETGKQWQIAGKFDSGSSGGPVISTNGMLVGLVFGGFNGTNISYVVPLNYFASFFQTAGLQLRECRTFSDMGTCDERSGGNCRPYVSSDSICFDPAVVTPLILDGATECHFSIFVRSDIVKDSWNYSQAASFPVNSVRAGPSCIRSISNRLPAVSDLRTRISCH
jgi:S1-C subfamily serine protease